MIRSFRHKGLRRFFEMGSTAGIQPAHKKKLQTILTSLESAVAVEDMQVPAFGPTSSQRRTAGALVSLGQRKLARDLRILRIPRVFARLRGLSLMPMHNPMHPGEFITEAYLYPHGVSGRELASKLDVAPSTLTRLLKGLSGVSPEMALRLSKTLGRSAESWLQMQQNYDLWQARQHLNLRRVTKLKLHAA